MYSKLHKTSDFTLLACCDKELLGKTFKEKELKIEIKEKFYKGQEVGEKELKKLLKKADNINLFGQKCVKVALMQGFIKEKDIIKVSGVPHVQIYKI